MNKQYRIVTNGHYFMVEEKTPYSWPWCLFLNPRWKYNFFDAAYETIEDARKLIQVRIDVDRRSKEHRKPYDKQVGPTYVDDGTRTFTMHPIPQKPDIE